MKQEQKTQTTKKIRLYNIMWDGASHLPTEDRFEVDIDFDVNEEGADLLSDEHGYCVTGFEWQLIGN